MLPRAEAPARRLPYTTADMAERLAKKKAEQDAAAQAKANQALRFGVTNPPVREDKGGGTGLWPSWGEIGNAAKMGLGGVAGMVNTVVATPLDIADEAVQGLEKVMGVEPTDKFDPASVGSFNLLGETYRGVDRAANYVGKQIAAIPGVGKPSSSPFMDTVRSQGWANAIAEPFVHAVNVGSVAYPASKMAVGAKLPGTIADEYRQRLLEREIAAQNNLFPAVQRPANVIDVDALQGSRLPARVVDSPATPATRLAEAQTQRALPPAATRALPPSAQRALPPATTADMAEQLARAQARQTTHFGTVSKEPISTMQSDEFAKIKTMTREDGGIPDPTSEIRQAYSLPVYEVGGKKVAFGTEGLGRFDPIFTDKNVEIIPFNPYVISGLSKATPEGQQMASTFFDAIHGFAMENNTQVALRNIGQVPALQLAASQGDNVALQELQRLAQVGQESINASRLEAQAKDLDWLKTSRSPYQQDLMVRTKDALGYEIQHPLNIDDLSFVHQTTYEPIIDANGNLIIKPSKDFAPIDPETGKPYIDKVTGKPLSANDQNSVHFSINHLAGGHIMRQSPVNGSYVIVAPAREILNANRGSLENLYAVDSFLTPKPAEGIVIPAGSFRIVKTPTLSDYGFKIPEGNPLLMPREIQNQIEKMYQQIINESSALTRQTIDEVLKSYNNSDGYRPLQIPAGSHYSDGGIIDATIMKIAREQIAQEYPEYIGGVTSAIHAHQPTHSLMGISELDPTDFRRSSISGNNYWMLSPNAKLRIYDTKKFTTGNLDTTFEPDYGI